MDSLRNRLKHKKAGVEPKAPAGAPPLARPSARPTRFGPTKKEISVRQMLEDGAKDFLKNLNFTGASFPGPSGPQGPPGPAGTGGVITIPPGGGEVGPQLIFNDTSVSAMTANVLALQTAINTAASVQAGVEIINPLLVGGARAYFYSTISIDTYTLARFSGGGVILDFSLAADGINYFSIDSSVKSGQKFFQTEMFVFENVIISGNGRNLTSKAFNLLTSYIKFEHVFTEFCGTGEYHNNNVYMIKHFECQWLSCGTVINIPNGTNKGEAIGFDACTVGVCNLWLNLAEPDAMVSFTNGSLDFPTKFVTASAGKIFISNSNIETNSATPDLWFELTGGENGMMCLRDNFIGMGSLSTNASAMFSIASTWRVDNYNPYMQGFQNTDDVLVIGTGANNYHQYNYRTLNVGSRPHFISDAVYNNALTDGTFASSPVSTTNSFLTILRDNWSIVNDIALVSNRTRGKGINLYIDDSFVPPGGTRSLRVDFDTGSIFRVIALLVPIRPIAQYVIGWSSACTNDANTSGNYGVTARWFSDMQVGPFLVSQQETSINWPSIAANSTVQGTDITVVGATTGDPVQILTRDPGAAFGGGGLLEFFGVASNTDTVTPFMRNPTSSTINITTNTFIARVTSGFNIPAGTGLASTEPFFALNVTPTTSFVAHKMPLQIQAPPQAPPWANWLYLQWNMGNQASTGSVYLGNVIVQKWSD